MPDDSRAVSPESLGAVPVKRRRVTKGPEFPKDAPGHVPVVSALPQMSSTQAPIRNSDYMVGQRVVYTPSRGRAELGTVRFVGDVTGRLIVGFETDDFVSGFNDGHHPTTGVRYFICDKGKGWYIFSGSSRLRCVNVAHPATTLQQRAQMKLLLGLEAMSESDALRLARSHRRAEHVLVSGSDLWDCARTYHKCWDANASAYRYFERRRDGCKVYRSSLPRDASISSIEGGPEAEITEAPQGVEHSWRIPSLSVGKVTLEEATSLFERCALQWREPLPAGLLLSLARSAQDLFLRDATLQRLSTPRNGRLIVVGDTHGHLKDLVHIWRKHGVPSSENIYVFNGDICDRGDSERRGGQQALTIWACILSFKIADAGSIFVNRGNHEDGLYWPEYGEGGFCGEIESKYSRIDADQLIEAFGDLCKTLPLATVIDGCCLVVHGGLPRTWSGKGAVNLADVERLKRPLAMPDSPTTREQQIIYDLTWADPQMGLGIGMNERGADVVSFGPDVTHRFLTEAGLQLLIRSHEVPGRQAAFIGRGYEWWHPICGNVSRKTNPHIKVMQPLSDLQKGWCLTVFSASDYCGCENGNASSHVVFTGHASAFAIVEHKGVEAEQNLLERLSEKILDRQPSSLEQHFLSQGILRRALVEKIVENKYQLLAEFVVLDTEYKWFLPVEAFVKCCYRVLPLITWEEIIDDQSIVPLHDGQVSYTGFLARYEIAFRNKLGLHSGFRRALTDHLFEGLLRADRTLRDTLSLVDRDGDGVVSIEEFSSALARFGKILTKDQARALYRTTIASSGSIRVEDFLGSLSVHFAMTHARLPPSDATFVPSCLDLICREVLDSAGVLTELSSKDADGTQVSRSSRSVAAILRDFFERLDRDSSGYLEIPELKSALQKMRACDGLSDDQLDAVCRYMDFDQNGRINYIELLGSLYLKRADGDGERLGASAVLEDALEAVHRVLHFEYARPLRALLRRMSTPGCSRVTPARFQKALSTLNASAGGGLLSEYQIVLLTDTIDATCEGSEVEAHFDFDDYFESFRIVDTNAHEDT